MKLLKELVWITQLGFSIVTPLLLCLLFSVWVRDRLHFGGWIILIGLFFGLGSAFSAGLSFVRHTRSLDSDSNGGKKPPVSFNSHD